MRGATVIAALALAAAGLHACSGSEESSGGGGGILGELVDEEVRDIDAEQGGELPLKSGANAEFGPGTLSGDATIAHGEYTAGEGIREEAISHVHNVTNRTPVGLNGSYRITIPYEAERITEGTVLKLKHQPYRLSEEGQPEPAGEIVDVPDFRDDRENAVVTADVRSFGAYWVALARPVEGDGEPPAERDAGVEREPDGGADLEPDGGADPPIAPDAGMRAEAVLGEEIQSTTQEVDPVLGATIVLESGATVDIPPGAVPMGEGVFFAEYTAGPAIAEEAVSNGFLLMPTGAGELMGEVTLTLPYDPDRAGAEGPLRLRHQPHVFDREGVPEPVGERADAGEAMRGAEGDRATATIGAFGAYWLAR